MRTLQKLLMRRRYRKRAAANRALPPARNPILVRALTALIVAPCIVYFFATVRTARDSRIQYTLSRNMTTAQFSAQLLDAQCSRALSVLGLLARRYELQDSLDSKDISALNRDIEDMVGLVPDLAFAAVYDRGGRILSRFPSSFQANRNARAKPWYEALQGGRPQYVSDVILLPGKTRSEAITMAMPLGRKGRPSGYLLAYYRLGEAERWLRQFGAQEGVNMVISTKQGRVIATSGTVPAGGVKDHPALAQVIGGEKDRNRQGTVVFPTANGPDTLAGYAVANIPAWVVMVNQPEDAALAGTNVLILRLAMLYLPAAAVIYLAIRALTGVYHRQEEMTRQLTLQNEKLRASDKTKSEFLANVSHDLWTPLAGIQLSISGLLDPKIHWSEEQIHDCLELAGEEVEQLTARVRNLLEMARLEADASLAPSEPCDLADIVGSALERLGPILRGRRVDAIFPPYPLMMEVRHAQFEMVVMNLVENAVKYAPPDSPLVLRGETRGEDIYFSLRDYGPGVGPGDFEKIFEKFYRAQKSHHMGGTGLGLAICKTIVEAHGGLIGVMNAQGGGAEFWFSVPALEPMTDRTGRWVVGSMGR